MGQRIKVEREARSWSQQQLANEVNNKTANDAKQLTQQALDRLEKRDSATSEFACRIADALGVSVRWLLDGVGDRKATGWPFPDQTLFSAVLALERDQLIEVQGAIRDKVALLVKAGDTSSGGASETAQLAA